MTTECHHVRACAATNVENANGFAPVDFAGQKLLGEYASGDEPPVEGFEAIHGLVFMRVHGRLVHSSSDREGRVRPKPFRPVNDIESNKSVRAFGGMSGDLKTCLALVVQP